MSILKCSYVVEEIIIIINENISWKFLTSVNSIRYFYPVSYTLLTQLSTILLTFLHRWCFFSLYINFLSVFQCICEMFPFLYPLLFDSLLLCTFDPILNTFVHHYHHHPQLPGFTFGILDRFIADFYKYTQLQDQYIYHSCKMYKMHIPNFMTELWQIKITVICHVILFCHTCISWIQLQNSTYEFSYMTHLEYLSRASSVQH